MSEIDNLYESLSEEEIAALAADSPEQHIIIDSDRNITIPDSLKKLGVQHDHNVETVTFDCPSSWDGVDMSNMKVYINWKNSGDSIGSYSVSNTYVTDDTPSGIMHFDWTITREVTESAGSVLFLVCIKDADVTTGLETFHWNSELCKDAFISNGFEVEASDNVQAENYDLITQLLLRADEWDEKIKTAVDASETATAAASSATEAANTATEAANTATEAVTQAEEIVIDAAHIAGIVQVPGNSQTQVMSQKVVTDMIYEKLTIPNAEKDGYTQTVYGSYNHGSYIDETKVYELTTEAKAGSVPLRDSNGNVLVPTDSSVIPFNGAVSYGVLAEFVNDNVVKEVVPIKGVKRDSNGNVLVPTDSSVIPDNGAVPKSFVEQYVEEKSGKLERDQVVVGKYPNTSGQSFNSSGNPIFIVANGDEEESSNAMEVYSDGSAYGYGKTISFTQGQDQYPVMVDFDYVNGENKGLNKLVTLGDVLPNMPVIYRYYGTIWNDVTLLYNNGYPNNLDLATKEDCLSRLGNFLYTLATYHLVHDHRVPIKLMEVYDNTSDSLHPIGYTSGTNIDIPVVDSHIKYISGYQDEHNFNCEVRLCVSKNTFDPAVSGAIATCNSVYITANIQSAGYSSQYIDSMKVFRLTRSEGWATDNSNPIVKTYIKYGYDLNPLPGDDSFYIIDKNI